MNTTTNLMQNIIMRIQCPFVYLLNKTLGITGKLNTKQRGILTFVLAAIFSIFLIIVISRFNPIDMQKKSVIFILGMIAIILVNMDKKVEAKQWNLPLMIPYYFVAIMMIITSFTHNTGRGELEIIGFIMIFIFTPFYIVIGNKSGEETERFFVLISKGFSYTGLVYIMALFLFFPQATQHTPDTGIPFSEYLGINTNPNALGFVLCSIVACSIYLYIKDKNKIIPIIVIAASLQLMILSVARASQLAYITMICLMLVAIIYYYKVELNKLGRGIILGVTGVAIIIISQPLWEYLFNYIQVTYATTETEAMSLYDRLNELSSGRMDVYSYYLGEVSWFGTDSSQGYVSEAGKSMYAHNNYLDIAFKSGIFAGIAYVLMIGTTFIYGIKKVLTTKGKEGLFTLIVLGGFIPYSMLETAIIPFHDGFMALVYLAMAGIIVKRNDKAHSKS